MIATDAKRLQAKLGVPVDGHLGGVSYGALFAKFGAAPERAAELGLAGAVHLARYGIDGSPMRLAHFLAQVAHESMGFHYMEEIASGQAYEGRDDLGNTQQGDGRRFKGRGPIQLTGRANYRSYGRELGIAFEAHPEIVAFPSIGLLAGCLYWHRNGLNELADRDDLVAITRKINGGTNGLDDRKARLAQAKALLL